MTCSSSGMQLTTIESDTELQKLEDVADKLFSNANIHINGITVNQILGPDKCYSFFKKINQKAELDATVPCTNSKSKFLCEKVTRTLVDDAVDVKSTFFLKLTDYGELCDLSSELN